MTVLSSLPIFFSLFSFYQSLSSLSYTCNIFHPDEDLKIDLDEVSFDIHTTIDASEPVILPSLSLALWHLLAKPTTYHSTTTKVGVDLRFVLPKGYPTNAAANVSLVAHGTPVHTRGSMKKLLDLMRTVSHQKLQNGEVFMPSCISNWIVKLMNSK